MRLPADAGPPYTVYLNGVLVATPVPAGPAASTGPSTDPTTGPRAPPAVPIARAAIAPASTTRPRTRGRDGGSRVTGAESAGRPVLPGAVGAGIRVSVMHRPSRVVLSVFDLRVIGGRLFIPRISAAASSMP